VGDGPWGVAYDPDNKYVYVVNFLGQTVSVVDQNNNVVDTIDVGLLPRNIAYNPNNGYMYITNSGSDMVSLIGSMPIANAGPTQTVDSGATVQLDGSGSSANGGSPIASYQWTQTSGPTVTLDDPTSATPSFTAPQTEVQENIVFQLVVTNEQGVESQPDNVTITVNPVTPVPP
jgi:YVTN family beta-propeller protein